MAFNVNELILDKVRSLTAHDLSDGKMLFRLTSLEEPSLATSAEGEEVVDAIGALITTLYRAKRATFSASNSLISLDLAAAQFGAEKIVASSDKKIKVPTYEIITIPEGATSVELKREAVGDVSHIYTIENGEIGTTYKSGSTASDTDFVFSKKEENVGDGKTITLPVFKQTVEGEEKNVSLTGKIYVEYVYESEEANQVINKTSEFPESCSMRIYAYFRDKCNDNIVYSGVIIANKAKLNPEQVELALTSTGKHAFEFQMMRDYCDEEAELFSIIVANDEDEE